MKGWDVNINEDEDLQTLSDVGVVDLVKKLMEDANKNKQKNKNNKKKLNLMKKRGNILLALLIMSLSLNVVFFVMLMK